MPVCAAFTAQMADFSISIEKSSHLSFLSFKEMFLSIALATVAADYLQKPVAGAYKFC